MKSTMFSKALLFTAAATLPCLTVVPALAQSDPSREILVYFVSGVERGPLGQPARVTSSRIQDILGRFTISQNGVASAFPNFNLADTLKQLPDGRVMRHPNMAKIFKLGVPANVARDSVINALARIPEVLFAEPNGTAAPEVVPNDQYFSYQWSLQAGGGTGRIQAPEAWDIYTGSSNSIIGIVDWGVDGTHPDLSGKVSGDAPSTDYHGTHVAGIAAAKTNNTTGVAGVDWSTQLLSKNIETSDDPGIYQRVVDAVNYSSNVNVLNNSWTLVQSRTDLRPRYSTTVRMAFAYAYKLNRVAVCANGNYQQLYPNQTYYPAGFGQGITAVGATDASDIVANFSQVNNVIDVSAPGVSILSTYRNGNNFSDANYYYNSGTSMATPHVSGIASLLKGYNANLYNDDIEHIIQLSADKVRTDLYTYDANGWNINVGYGRVNARRALDRLRLPYFLTQHTASGGSDVGSTGTYVHAFFSTYGLADGAYIVRRHEVRRTISLPYNYTAIPDVWGRGVATNGFSLANPNFGMGWCEVVPGTVTSTNATLRTYVYEVWDLGGYWVGWVPTNPANATFGYTVLGTFAPLSLTLSGPDCLFFKQIGTYAANVSGGSGYRTYQWYRSFNGGASWTASGTAQTQQFTMVYDDFLVRCDVHDSQTGEDASRTLLVQYCEAKLNPSAGISLPRAFALHEGYPNPFNPTTTIEFDLPEDAVVALNVFDVLGRKVGELASGNYAAGYHSVIWYAQDAASGIYFARFTATKPSGKVAYSKINKLILVK
jgi:hypothetical protein